ncbi:hypothetical protein CYJ40_06240 [Brevibacterium ravenspurgense]|uniref:CorA-like Mg2+ transporter protein n=1 Tax=Brevibacterium ravenspurgense TaxID=479117 RepID=A0A2I1IGR8_9MICO|nr:hypothetical protein [Brevibacterium ravenspurgense]PKY70324.1 hypothetical protein CYJ40_06240 [Brevibacterium ravenspurgense]
MNFILVSPLQPDNEVFLESENLIDDSCKSDEPEQVFVTRKSNPVELLSQCWEEKDPAALQDRFGFEIIAVHLAKLASTTVSVIECKSVSRKSPDCSAHELELILNDVAQSVLKETGTTHRDGEVKWTARYAVTETGSELPIQWIDAGGKRRFEEKIEAGEEIVFQLGWGNGLLYGWNQLSAADRQLFREGFVDAQHIWIDLEELSEQLKNLRARINRVGEKVKRGTVREIQTELASLRSHEALHDEYCEEMVIATQGLRREVSDKLLSEWRHEEVSKRLETRINHVSDHARTVSSRVSNAYARSTENVLLFLGAISLIDLCLNLIAAAFSGSTVEEPKSFLVPIFETVREKPMDVPLIVSVVVVVIIVTLFSRRSR